MTRSISILTSLCLLFTLLTPISKALARTWEYRTGAINFNSEEYRSRYGEFFVSIHQAFRQCRREVKRAAKRLRRHGLKVKDNAKCHTSHRDEYGGFVQGIVYFSGDIHRVCKELPLIGCPNVP